VRSTTAPSSAHVLVLGAGLIVALWLLAQGLGRVSFPYAAGALGAALLFGLAFVRTDFGLYVIIFSMLLSPEFGGQGGGLAEGRSVTLRTEDFVLIVVALSWLAKTAVNKQLGLVARTPLNRAIVFYIAASVIATLVGYLTGTVGTAAGFFYVLKYVEYFFVYYMVVNNLRDRTHAWRLARAAFLTAVIVSVIGLAQVPSGQRVSAPFEGEVGEPNTFGGYLLFMIALATGIAIETRRVRTRLAALGLCGLMAVPFLFTLSRASYLGVIPAAVVFGRLTSRRRLVVGLLLLVIVCSPILIAIAPASVLNRIVYTFEAEHGQPTVRVGKVGLDPSTSARLISVRQALDGWRRRPIFGYGVTGFGFMDAQYARVLVETGVIGFLCFLWLLWRVGHAGADVWRSRRDPDERGLALGFLAGYGGLLAHAIGSNTFIIVRIMEPFWLFTGIVLMLPTLEADERSATAAVRPAAAGSRA